MAAMLTIATLGPEGSNHEMVAQRYARAIGIDPVRLRLELDFERVARLVASGEADCAIQCAAHPEVARTIGANIGRLHLVDAFVAPGRELAVLTRVDAHAPESIAFHPATRSYVDLGRWSRLIEAQSTVAVARGLLEGLYDSGITTVEFADQHPGRFRIDARIPRVDDGWLVYAPARAFEGEIAAWPQGPGAALLRELHARRANPGARGMT